MTVKYARFELPTNIKIEEGTKTNTFSRFIAEPFERGFGHTIGNALRRIMLTSLEAPAIISIRIEGVPHEYIAVDGVIEDMTHVVLNFKGALLRKLTEKGQDIMHEPKVLSKVLDVTQDMLDMNGGQYGVKFKDVMDESDFEIINPDHHLFVVTKPMMKLITLRVAVGRGYVPSERHQIVEKVVDEIVIDSAFSPVRVVNYFVENTRVGQDTDYDRLILEVTTDQRVTPQEALTFATQIGIHHFNVFDALKYQELSFDSEDLECDTDRDNLFSKLALHIGEIELSVRSTNCLVQANIGMIAELVTMPESEMLKFRNFGKKSLNEIKAKLEDMGLYLGMDLAKYGINRNNVKQIMEEYLEEKSKQELL